MPDISDPENVILIIDDSVETIRALNGILSEQGKVLFAMTGEEGIQLARQHRPDLILLDVEMTPMNGHQVCQKLKSDIDTQHCPVMFVTAHTNPEIEVAALEEGAVDFVSKPFNPLVVRARVQTHLRMHRYSSALALLANRDSLTGLYARRYFDEQLEKEFQRHRRHQLPLGLAFIDIDYFKMYNDGYGHSEGDRCLEKVARAIGANARRPGEIAARYGGEEFIVLLPHTNPEEAQRYGEAICSNIRDQKIAHAYSSAAGNVTVSVGMTSIVPNEGDSAKQLIQLADQALYEAKSAGRDRSKFASEPKK